MLPKFVHDRWTQLFDGPVSWSDFELNAGDDLKGWRVLVEEAKQVVLSHTSGAIALLHREADTITKLELSEGDAARRLLGKHGLRPSKSTERLVRGELGPGTSIESGMDRAFPKRLDVIQLCEVDDVRLLRVGSEGVLELRAREGKVVKTNWRVGSDALALIEQHRGSDLTKRGW